MRGRVSGYVWSCLRHSHDAPPCPLTLVFSAVTLILTSPSSSLANARWMWRRGQDIRTIRASSMGRPTTIWPRRGSVESGRGEQRGEVDAENFLGLGWAQAELGAQRLPE